MTRSVPASVPLACVKSEWIASPESRCWISFGGNVGDVRATFDAALTLLSRDSRIRPRECSGLYLTAPMGTEAGDSYLNSVCGLTTVFSPQELIRVLQSVENQLGRNRVLRWGPRTLDLDLLSYGELVLDEPDLVIPHPATTYRRFVLDPLMEIAPNWRHPIYRKTACQFAEILRARPLRISMIGIPRDQIETLSQKVATNFPDVELLVDVTNSSQCLTFQTSGTSTLSDGIIVDLRRSPGDTLEQLTSALTAIFDEPERISDW